MKTAISLNTGSLLLILALVLLPVRGLAEESYSPYAGLSYPSDVFWGDTHVHTYLSADAVFKLGPDDAYRFARGEEVTSISGQRVRRSRPLDFMVIADHGKNMGAQLARRMSKTDPAFAETPIGRLWAEVQEELLSLPGVNRERVLNGHLWPRGRKDVPVTHPGFRRSIWEQVTATADHHNVPGRFTAFIGYEYTPWAYQIHRVVIFKDDAEKVSTVLPFSAFDSDRPEDLWDYLKNYQQSTGGDVLAIPHNSNLTFGKMFDVVDSDGQPFTKAYALQRSYWEPLVEATQIKGDSETHPVVSPADGFADFETWNGWQGRQNGGTGWNGKPIWKRPDEKVQYEYARPALKLGLDQQAGTGVNPFKFGMIGSSDIHMALPGAVDENNYWGFTPSPKRVTDYRSTINWEMNAAGYAAVWATANTREALFEAMRRREVYASTGPRIVVRFFGGWEYRPDDALRPDLARIGYSGGVPMGGDLTQAPEGKSPRFLIRAVKDPGGANLDRVQVIKGWRSADGTLHEKIHNAALSDGRKEDVNGRVEPVGNTVDVANASYTNSIGDPELAVVWVDPDFDPEELAFYYLRVLEIPTTRWTAYDAKFYGLKDLPEKIPMVTQERAYSSPIWYSP